MSETPTPLPTMLAHNKRVVLQALRAQGVHRAVISYHGQGDEGQTDSLEFFGADGQLIEEGVLTHVVVPILEHRHVVDAGHWTAQEVPASQDLPTACDSLAWAIVETLHGGFFNGDGGDGEVHFQVSEDDEVAITVSHNDFYTASTHTETTL